MSLPALASTFALLLASSAPPGNTPIQRAPRGPDVSLYRPAVCGVPGQACCRWPNALEGIDARHCNAGAGCDIATDTCVAPCGAAGQVCCDGPDTYAPQGNRSPTGGLYCQGADCVPRKQMCAAGACPIATRRCDETCGKTEGGACCAPDAGIAVASCKSPEFVCDFSDTSLDSGTCVRCGGMGAPACPGGNCNPVPPGQMRTVERNGVCVACGYVGLPECASGRRCDAGSAPDPRSDLCSAAGGTDQPCMEDGFCGYDGMFCDQSRTCRVCGSPGQPCCPDQPLLGGGRLKPCGGWSNLQCAEFNGRQVCQYRPGQGPGGGGGGGAPPPGPRTCGGELYQIGVTNTFVVWVRQPSGCAFGVQYQANSTGEAAKCAAAVYGSLVIEEPVEQYEFSMDGPLGCRTVHVYAKDEDDGGLCAYAQCHNCSEPRRGSCP